MPFEYLLSLLVLLLIALFLKKKYKVKVFTSPKQILIFYIVVLGIGTIWDNFAVFRGHWNYPGPGITGIFIILVPIEDYVFAFVTSFTVLVLYKIISKKYK